MELLSYIINTPIVDRHPMIADRHTRNLVLSRRGSYEQLNCSCHHVAYRDLSIMFMA